MQNFEELLRARLAQPIKDKQGNLIVNQDTQSPMTALDAMVMSVVNNAMKGDIASIAFIRNMTHSPDAEADRCRQEEMQNRTTAIKDNLLKQLQAQQLYDGQDIELEQVAATALLVEQLTEQMRQSDFQPTVTEYRRDGSTQAIINPLVTLRDQQQQRFQQQLDKLRQDAINRRVIRKHT